MSSKLASQQPRRKSTSKRFLVHSDDDDNDAPVPQRSKRPRTADSDPPLSAATTPYDNEDMDVDMGDSPPRSVSATNDSRFLPDDYSTQDTRADTSKKRKKATVGTASTKKKPPAFYSDDEASNSHIEHDSLEELTDLDSPLSEVSEDSDPDTPPKRGALKGKASAAKGKPGKVKPGQLKGAKANKDKERDRAILMKDERRLAVPPSTTSRASSVAAQSQPSDLFANDDLASTSAADPDVSQPTKDPLNQTIPKKRKLPPIKKTKTAGSGTSTSTPTTTTQKPAPPPVQELAKPSLPTSEQRKQALTGVRDVDLGDSKIYAELFKGAGGNTPKSGLKNAEERRKELDRMRDEARARRAEEMKFTFDLQSQGDKIARFEQRLRAENGTALHPNFLAAKFREEWEVERRNKRATSKEEGEA